MFLGVAFSKISVFFGAFSTSTKIQRLILFYPGDIHMLKLCRHRQHGLLLNQALKITVCGVLMVLSAQAMAEERFIGVSAAYARDSNIYRLSKRVGDAYTSLGVVAGLDQTISRQRFFANGSIYNNRYNERTELNNTRYRLSAGWDWETINHLSGNISTVLSENLVNYGSFVGEPALKKNLETSQNVALRVQYGGLSLLTLEGTAAVQHTRYSAVEYAAAELDQVSGGVGLKYRPRGALTLGSGVRYTKGKYPRVQKTIDGSYLGDVYNRYDLDLTATWEASGFSTVNARLSLGKQTNTGIQEREFSGLTGSLGWAYAPTGKLKFNTTLLRDTGASSSIFSLTNNQAGGLSDNSRLTNTLAVNAMYQATAKIRLNSDLRLSRRDLVNTLAGGTDIKGKDSLASLVVGASYEPLRSVLLSCELGRDVRSQSGDLSYPYQSTRASCMAQFTLQ
jgi:hypothetical protein